MNGKWHLAAAAAVAAVLLVRFSVVALWFAVLFAAIILFAAVASRRSVPAVCSAIFILTSAVTVATNHFNRTELSPDASHFRGTIASLPVLDGNQWSFRLKLNRGETLRVVAYLDHRAQIPIVSRFRYGMECRLTGKLKKPEPPSNFYSFDYRKYLYRRHIHWILTPQAVSPHMCRNTGYSLFDRLHQWRGAGIRFIDHHFPPSIQGISEALLFGWKQNIPPPILTAYRNLGLIHLLAVSGLHVGMVIAALFALLLRLGLTKERSLELLLVLLPIYPFMTGASPSVVRACFMAMIILIAMRFRLRFHALDAISWAAIAMLLFHPSHVYQTGFQLSFLISFTLIVSAPAIMKRYESRFARMLAVSVIAQFASLPILLSQFYQISLLSLPLNLVFIPFITLFVMPLACVSFFAYLLVPPLGEWLANGLKFPLDAAHALLRMLDSHGWGLLVFGKPSIVVVLLMYGVIAYGLLKWEDRGGTMRMAVPFVLFAALGLYQWNAGVLSETGTVTMLDVGQGDSFLIELPHRRAVYLIDTGGTVSFEPQWKQQKKTFKVGRDVVLPELKARGIRRLDALILTHKDMDHLGGAKSLLKHMAIRQIMYGAGTVTAAAPKEVFRAAKAENVPIVRVEGGDSWHVNQSLFFVLNPVAGEREGNNRSIVIRARIGGLWWLFTGDLEKEGEQALLRSGQTLHADVLKVAHHGSDTSTNEPFLKKVDPAVAWISVGEHNRYGHPSAQVIHRLESHGVLVFRTDQRGAVRYRFGAGDDGFGWMH
ncbi:MAG TPA: DNA internalization-related competence protein ComEC/Rec2 [Bacillales bacterium]|nr:DNA internalization-related competence protein ComEC/Rec2 [Bacillales bacterium]